MKPEELKPIVEASGSALKFAELVGVREGTVYRWLAGGTMSVPVIKLIGSLKPTKKE